MNTFRPPPDDPREQRIIEALRDALQRPEAIDPEAEERALAAFRLARLDAGHPVRTRHRDDWRRHPLRLRGAWRAALAAVVASCALGGAAYATFVTLPAHDGGRPTPSPTPSSSASAGLHHPSPSPAEQSPGTPPASPGGAVPGLVTAQDRAHCRAYLKHPARTAARRPGFYEHLVRAAGSERNVAAFCTAAVRGVEPEKAGGGRPGKGEKKATKDKDEKGGPKENNGKGNDEKPQPPVPPSPTQSPPPDPAPDTSPPPNPPHPTHTPPHHPKH